jgi:hypothetical protein
MSLFEIIMLLCFGFAWPFSIYKSYKSRSTQGKSIAFLIIIVLGYLAGILHKLFYHYDGVIFFYILNLLMVMTDILLYLRNAKLARKNEAH